MQTKLLLGLRCLSILFTNLIETQFSFKGNVQILFLCNPQKSGTSRVYIPFPHITQKLLTKDIIHWLELITEKHPLSFFNISENLQEN